MDLWRVLKALLFAGRVALSPSPVDIGASWVSFAATEPMEALNQGALLVIDVTQQIPVEIGLETIVAASKTKFPPGCVEARLRLPGNATIELRNRGTLVSQRSVELSLQPNGNWPLTSEFAAVDIRATCAIANAKVSFQNAGK
jgi:hypothetical protein